MNEKLFKVLASEAERRVSEFEPQEFGNIAWAFATVDHLNGKLAAAMMQPIKQCVCEFRPQTYIY